MRLLKNNTVRARAPLRLGLAGGGTDLSPYCDTFGGAVLNATISRYAMVTISHSLSGKAEFVCRDMGGETSATLRELCAADAVFESKFALSAAAYRHMLKEYIADFQQPLRIETSIDAAAGSGLGSSSALVVALVMAFVYAFDLPLGQYEIGELAWRIERVDLDLAGGKQDQYAAAFGGVNFIEFIANNRVVVNPLRLPSAALLELDLSLLVAYTGVSRQSENIIRDQVKSASNSKSDALEALHALKSDAYELKAALLKWDVQEMGAVLNRSWLHKKQTSSLVSSNQIDELYALALRLGALGGKVSGAGGGGYMMFLVDPAKRNRIRFELREAGADADFVSLTNDGAQAWLAPRFDHM